MIVAIYARSLDGVIGAGGQIPWKHRVDMQLFRAITLDLGVVVMGRRTMESLPGQKSLRGRVNMVLTSRPLPEDFQPWTGTYKGRFAVVGGAGVYRRFHGMTDVIVETTLDLTVEGDTRVEPVSPSCVLCYEGKLRSSPGDTAPASVRVYLTPHSRVSCADVSQWLLRFSPLLEV